MAGLASTVPELSFTVDGVGPHEHSAGPAIRLALRIGGGPVRSVALQTQVRIAAARRPYDAQTRERLRELFGTAEQWDGALRSLLWTTAGVVAGPFDDETVVELELPCTYDLEVTSAKYLNAVRDGSIPLELLFSGTVFYAGPGGALQIARIPWEAEAHCSLPGDAWRAAMDRHFPGAAWLRLDADAFDRLHAFRTRHALLSWEATVDALLEDRE